MHFSHFTVTRSGKDRENIRLAYVVNVDPNCTPLWALAACDAMWLDTAFGG